MKMITLLVCFFILVSCGPGSQVYRNISEFNLNPTALKEEEPIKIIFAMVGKTNNKKDKYYNQLIAVSQETGDTCNILVPVDHGLLETDADRVFHYNSPRNKSAMIILEPEKIKDGINIDDINIEFPRYDKVIYNSKYQSWLKNNYPTVFGLIGTIK